VGREIVGREVVGRAIVARHRDDPNTPGHTRCLGL